MNCKKIINESTCNLEMKYFSDCPRLNMGWYLCPNCDKREYEKYFPTKEQMCKRNIEDIFKNVIGNLNDCEEKELVLQGLINKLNFYFKVLFPS